MTLNDLGNVGHKFMNKSMCPQNHKFHSIGITVLFLWNKIYEIKSLSILFLVGSHHNFVDFYFTISV